MGKLALVVAAGLGTRRRSGPPPRFSPGALIDGLFNGERCSPEWGKPHYLAVCRFE